MPRYSLVLLGLFILVLAGGCTLSDVATDDVETVVSLPQVVAPKSESEPAEPSTDIAQLDLVPEASESDDKTPSVVEAADVPEEYVWNAPPVVAMLHYGVGAKDWDSANSVIPSVVVYADGRVIYSTFDSETYQRAIWDAQISSAEICSLLNQISKTGFLSYSQASYVESESDHDSTAYITVNAWQPNHISAYGLGDQWDEDEEPYGPDELLDVETLLLEFEPIEAVPFQPERVKLILSEANDMFLDDPAPLWPLESPSLSDLFGPDPERRSIVDIEGPDALAVYNVLKEFRGGMYSDGTKTYYVLVKPHYPYQKATSSKSWSPPPSFDNVPTIELRCGKSDVTATPSRPTVEPTGMVDESTPEPTPFTVETPTSQFPRLAFANSQTVWHNRDAQIGIMADPVAVTEQGHFLVADWFGNRVLPF